jgi:membrane-associated phospholipid phosphatase
VRHAHAIAGLVGVLVVGEPASEALAAAPEPRRADVRAYEGPTAVDASAGSNREPVIVGTTAMRAPAAAEPAQPPPPTITSPRLPPPRAAAPAPTRAVEQASSVRIRPALDIAILVGAAVPSVALGVWVTPSLPSMVDAPRTDDDEIGRFDRSALGRYDDRYAKVSDALLGVSIAAPVGYHALEAALYRRGYSQARGRGFLARFGTDLVVYGQALAINELLTQILKAAIRRPRPYAYLDPATLDGPARAELIADQMEADAAWSFPSGHTSAAFAAGTAGATLLTLELLGRAHWAIAVAWVGGVGVAGTTAAMRVLAGRHFPSDVVTSALLGSAVGIAVPLAHWRPRRPGDIVRRNRRPRRWALTPMPTRGGGGLGVTGTLP